VLCIVIILVYPFHSTHFENHYVLNVQSSQVSFQIYNFIYYRSFEFITNIEIQFEHHIVHNLFRP